MAVSAGKKACGGALARTEESNVVSVSVSVSVDIGRQLFGLIVTVKLGWRTNDQQNCEKARA